MIYTSAHYANAGHTLVTGTDEHGEFETVPFDFTLFRQPDDGPLGFVRNGGVIAEYVEPEPIPVAPHLNGGGLVRFSGGSPSTVYEAIRMLSVTRVAKGRYRAYHEAPMPSDQYSSNASVLDASPRIARVTVRTPVYVEVRVTDLAGAAQDPTEVTIETQRVIYS